ncbi:hypothetical protein SNE40_010044 [Patella caerulea]|uniref:Uncharacterized protein n=1 Tax=Patella caerulea TaxID=87958 RepID=A0AAN8JUH0_PATCE
MSLNDIDKKRKIEIDDEVMCELQDEKRNKLSLDLAEILPLIALADVIQIKALQLLNNPSAISLSPTQEPNKQRIILLQAVPISTIELQTID